MALTQFPAAMNDATATVLEAAAALRYVSESTGDLTWQSLHRIQNSLAAAQIACVRALTEAQAAPVAAENYMAPLGGPATIAEFSAGLQQVQTASTNWATALENFLSGLSPSDFRSVVWVTISGSNSARLEDAGFIPAVRANPLRATPELAALIAAFEAVGA